MPDASPGKAEGLPVAFVRGIGIGGMLIPLISCAATLTIVPALLAGGGRRLDWPHLRHEAVPAPGQGHTVQG